MRRPLGPGTPVGVDGGLVRSGALVALGSLVGRASGLVGVWALLAVVGNSNRLADAYNIANNLPNILYELFAGGVLSAALVPLFVECADRGDDEGTRSLVGAALVGLVVLTGLSLAASPALAWAFSLGVPDADYRGALQVLLLWLLPQVLFYGLVTVLGALHNARGSFARPAFAPAVNNVVVVVGLLAVAPVVTAGADTLGPLAAATRQPTALPLLGAVTTAGVLASALVLVGGVGRARLRGTWSVRHPVVGRLARASGWTFGYVAANQVTTLVVIALANRDGAGAASSYLNAYRFFVVPHGILAVSLLTVVLPGMSRLAQQGRDAELARRWAQGYRATALLVVPAAGALWLLGALGLRLVTADADAADIAAPLSLLALGLPGFSLFLYSLRLFYAEGDTRTPFLLNLFENAVQLGLSLPLGLRFGAPGLAAAHTLAYGVAAVVASRRARRRLGGAGEPVLGPVSRALLAGVAGTASAALVVALATGRGPLGASAGASAAGDVVAVALGGAVLLVVYGALAVAGGAAADIAGLARLRGRSDRQPPSGGPDGSEGPNGPGG